MSKLVRIAFLQSVVATFGSLYLSEVAGFIPCKLCWFQRICMYPLTVILLVGLWRKSNEIHFYVLPLSILGWLISLYHNLLYFGIIPETVSYTCSPDVPCTTDYLQLFGFITIPMLSFTAFTVISYCLVYYQNRLKLEKTSELT